MLLAFRVIRRIQQIMRGKPGAVVADSYVNFGDGINVCHAQTRDGFLILEGYYGHMAHKVHTPLGYWKVCSNVHGPSTGFHVATNAVLDNPAWKVALVCPGFQTNAGFEGPWYLMTEFKGASLLPQGFVLPPFQGDMERHYDNADVDFATLVRPRLALLRSLSKNTEDWLAYNQGCILAKEAVRNAYVAGLWSDPTAILSQAKAAASVEESARILCTYEQNSKYGIAFSDYHRSKAQKVAEALHAREETYHEDLLSLLCYSDTYVPKDDEL